MTQDQIIQLCRGFESEGFDGQAAAILTLAAVLAGDAQPDAKPLTVRQAAQRLGVSADSVYDLCRDGRLRCFRAGEGRGTIRIRPADLHRFQIEAA
jgi:excisionase family DNA binding protein